MLRAYLDVLSEDLVNASSGGVSNGWDDGLAFFS